MSSKSEGAEALDHVNRAGAARLAPVTTRTRWTA
jgi:hypothetical protein